MPAAIAQRRCLDWPPPRAPAYVEPVGWPRPAPPPIRRLSCAEVTRSTIWPVLVFIDLFEQTEEMCAALFEACFLGLLWLMLGPVAGPAKAENVLTYHYDTLRTGWNSHETTLSPGSVAGSGFGLLHRVILDEQVDAQHLLFGPLTIGGKSRTVVYVATENNTIYAVAASTGSIVNSRNLGLPVPVSVLPGKPDNNSASVGIDSTPVIDPATSTLYVTAYTYVNDKKPTWILHALDLVTLADKILPVTVQASATLSDGSTYNFNALVSHQRSRRVYLCPFGSFCDVNKALRGFVMGWQAATLIPLPGAYINDKRRHAAAGFF
jgi:hypothetical protein